MRPAIQFQSENSAAGYFERNRKRDSCNPCLPRMPGYSASLDGRRNVSRAKTMNVHVYFSIEKDPDILSVVCQDTDGRTIAEWAEEPTLDGLSITVHKKLPYRLRKWLELPARGKEPSGKKTKTDSKPPVL
jgi:hypothetical protein